MRTNRSASRIRVLHVLGRMEQGGVENRLLEVIGRLRDEFRIDVCALSGLEGSLDAQVRATGGEVMPLPLNRAFPRRFLRLLRQGHYDVVHSHVLYASGPVLALARLARIPVRVAHFRATEDGRVTTPWRQLQRRLMCQLIDRCATDIVGCGEGALDAIWSAGWRSDSRCRVIHNTVDIQRFDTPVDRGRMRQSLGVPIDAKLFLHVGRESLDDQKNHRRLLEIFAAIARLDPAAWLVLAGAGTDDKAGESAAAIQALHLEHRVIPLGVRTDVPELMRTADALLLPSRWEGLPGVVLEACAIGLPVLASDLPGVREIATQLDLVRTLTLMASDGHWARIALALPSEADRLALRDHAATAFRASVFHLDRGVAAHRTLWARAELAERIECS